MTVSVVGKMKLEYPEKPIYSFYGTSAKCYFVRVEGDVIKKAKGVRKNIIKSELHENDYISAVENRETILREMNVFTSKFHDLYTELKHKIALRGVDDKRYLLPESTRTLAWGHKDISLIEEKENCAEILFQVLTDLKTSNDEQNRSIEDELERIFQINNVSEDFLNGIYEQLQTQS